MTKRSSLFGLAVLSLIVASCVNEIYSDQAMEEMRRYTLSFEDQTKTGISGTGNKRSIHWTDGDQIKYYTEPNQSNPITADVVIDGSSAVISIPRGQTDEFINAVYGATQLNSNLSTSDCMFVSSPVKSKQRYSSFAEAHVCAAFSEDIENTTIRFRNAVCIVSFTSSAAVHKVVFSGNNGEIINAGSDGDLKISLSGDVLTVESAANSSATDQTSVTIDTNGDESDFYFAILPVCFSNGITVKCYDSEDCLLFAKKVEKEINTISGSGAVKMIGLGRAQDWINSVPTAPDELYAVDLGLSVKWAPYNVGATKPEEYGDYFAWGETASKKDYKWTNYQFGTSKNGPFSKYVIDSGYGTVDHKIVLDPEDDAAYTNWNGNWRLPSNEEAAELIDNCTWSWTTRNGVKGYKVTGPSGNFIFLPANGMRSGTSLSDAGSKGNYWSSSLSADGAYFASSPFFNQSEVQSGNNYRYLGLGVRPVYGAVVPVSSISLPKTLSLTDTTPSLTLTATVRPANATYKSISWVSSNEAIATVDSYGRVTAVSVGKAKITAYSADGTKSASCTVTVEDTSSINLGATSDGTANCYIVSEPGYYSFKPVKGNSNKAANALTPKSADILWQSYGTDEAVSTPVITDVEYYLGLIHFSVPSPMKNGNAVIAARDANGQILWSWHIWACSGFDPAETMQVYLERKCTGYDNDNNPVIKLTGKVAGNVMDRNLGAFSATPGELAALGLLYQWGRKDPFPGSSIRHGATQGTQPVAVATGSWPKKYSQVSVAYSIENPTTFVCVSNLDWQNSSTTPLWDADSKTIYDPCPPGWMVPRGGDNGLWAKSTGLTYGNEAPFDSVLHGVLYTNFTASNAAPVWVPSAGYITANTGTLGAVGGQLYLWSATPKSVSDFRAYSLFQSSASTFTVSALTLKAQGCSVRCVKEQ